jgi:hypothetical protein
VTDLISIVYISFSITTLHTFAIYSVKCAGLWEDIHAEKSTDCSHENGMIPFLRCAEGLIVMILERVMLITNSYRVGHRDNALEYLIEH